MRRICLSLLILWAPTVRAQDPRPLQPARAQSVAVLGSAYDSLGQRPLPSAFVSLGTARNTFTDSLGRFRFDSVALGVHRVEIEHPAIDSLGLSGISASITVRAGMDTVRVAIPSFATMWSRVCGSERPGEAGFIFGVVRDSRTRRPVANAEVSSAWLLPTSADFSAMLRTWKVETKTDADGSYALCGLPTTTTARVTAVGDAAAAAITDLSLTPTTRVTRRDLTLGGTASSIARGTVVGIVTSQGRPLPDVRVLADWTDESVTARDGRFTLVGVPVGTRQLYMIPLGMPTATVTVDVVETDTARLAIALRGRDAAAMNATMMQARLASGFALRRRLGVGYFRDSTYLKRFSNFFAAFSDLRVGVVRARPGGIRIDLPDCPDTPVWIDGRRAPGDIFLKIDPADLSGVEIYQRYETPAELRANGINISPRNCSVILWTHRK